MCTYRSKRAIEILQQKGPTALAKASIRFTLDCLDPEFYRRFKLYTLKNHWENHIRYDAPPDPYKTINISPKELDGRLRRNNGDMIISKVKNGGIGRTRDGEWDQYQKNIEDCSDIRGAIIKGLRERLQEEKDWKSTSYFHFLKNKYEKKDVHEKYGYKSLESYIMNRLRAYDRLYAEIKKSGYKKNHQGKTLRPGDQWNSHLEVLVTIDRQGRINLFDGYHRFGIARVLDLQIPVQVVCRHRRWQKIRDKLYNDTLSITEHDKLRSHPDLQDIIN